MDTKQVTDFGNVIADDGQFKRVERAVNALVAVLRSDARFQAVYREWHARHGGNFSIENLLANASYLENSLQNLVNRIGLHPWLPALLASDMKWHLVFGHGYEQEAPVVEGLPPGRQPKGDDYIERDVEWYYRTKFKEPRETEYAIAKENTARKGNGRKGAPNVSPVQRAIARTAELFLKIEGVS